MVRNLALSLTENTPAREAIRPRMQPAIEESASLRHEPGWRLMSWTSHQSLPHQNSIMTTNLLDNRYQQDHTRCSTPRSKFKDTLIERARTEANLLQAAERRG